MADWFHSNGKSIENEYFTTAKKEDLETADFASAPFTANDLLWHYISQCVD